MDKDEVLKYFDKYQRAFAEGFNKMREHYPHKSLDDFQWIVNPSTMPEIKELRVMGIEVVWDVYVPHGNLYLMLKTPDFMEERRESIERLYRATLTEKERGE